MSTTQPEHRWLIVHQNSELYGADRILIEVAGILNERGAVLVLVPVDGPLVGKLRERGVDVRVFPQIFVVRKQTLRPTSWPGAARSLVSSVRALRRVIKQWRPTELYVNTVTIPSPIVAGRLSGLPVVVHVHEAETLVPRIVRKGLLAPLLLSTRLVVISEAVKTVTARSWPSLQARSSIVRNPIRPPTRTFDDLPAERPAVLQVILPGRWSPRKGTDLAIAACAEAARRGVSLHLTLVGGVYEGYEWFEQQIREQAQRTLPDCSFVAFADDLDDIWRRAHITLVPSRIEPYGLVAAESLLRGRITIASDLDGLPEIVIHERSGLLSEPQVGAFADALERVWLGWPEMVAMSAGGRRAAADWTLVAFETRLLDVLGTTGS